MRDLFDFGSRDCPKCGSFAKVSEARYHSGSGFCNVNQEGAEHYKVDAKAVEHLHYQCGACGYDWGTHTKDAVA